MSIYFLYICRGIKIVKYTYFDTSVHDTKLKLLNIKKLITLSRNLTQYVFLDVAVIGDAKRKKCNREFQHFHEGKLSKISFSCR